MHGMMDEITLDPWGQSRVEDYTKLFSEFGISPFEELLDQVPDPHLYMRRKIIFGHRGYEQVLDAMLEGDPFAVMSGFMPSGRCHLGAKMVMDEIIWHQQQGADAFVGIADLEAHAVRGTPWEECKRTGVDEYILSLIALGFQPEGHIYFQSESDNIRNLTFELGCAANFSELSAIYGLSSSTNISHMISVLTQSADIMQPQLDVCGGPKPTVIPVGADQDPHIRLTRDISDRMRMFNVFRPSAPKQAGAPQIQIYSKSAHDGAFDVIMEKITGIEGVNEHGKILKHSGHIDIAFDAREFTPFDLDVIHEDISNVARKVEIELGGYGFYPPASIYHRFMTGLTGGKMSSSVEESYIALIDDPDVAAEKVKRGMTGGRPTLKEQRELGGMPDKCTICELLWFHLIKDDDKAIKLIEQCRSGEIVCGECKEKASDLMREFLLDHQERKELARERLHEYGINTQ